MYSTIIVWCVFSAKSICFDILKISKEKMILRSCILQFEYYIIWNGTRLLTKQKHTYLNKSFSHTIEIDRTSKNIWMSCITRTNASASHEKWENFLHLIFVLCDCIMRLLHAFTSIRQSNHSCQELAMHVCFF